jgi:hypothetical protein
MSEEDQDLKSILAESLARRVLSICLAILLLVLAAQVIHRVW